MHDIGRLHDEKDVVAAMQDADALLFPSRSEGHPLVVIEAMACGLPVIATHGSSLAEVVQEGSTGMLCIMNDIDTFARACRELAADPVRLENMSHSAREEAAASYSALQMIDRYINAYMGAFNGRSVHLGLA